MSPKLKDFSPVFWLNLDGDEKRKIYMENWFSKFNLNAKRISAYDGRTNDLRAYLTGSFPPNISQEEVGCVLSHLKAIKQFVEETDDDYAIVLEDDVDFVSVAYWPFDWKFVLSSVPYDWDVLQLVIINPWCLITKLHPRQSYDFSAAAYAITRHYAKKLLRLHVDGEKYKIDNGVKPRPVADELIYNSGKTYSLPLLLVNIELDSYIHQEHIQLFHKPCMDALYNFWVKESATLSLEEFFNLHSAL